MSKRVHIVKKVVGKKEGGLFGFDDGLNQSITDSLFDRELAYKKYAKMLAIARQFALIMKSVSDSKLFPSTFSSASKFAQFGRDLISFINASITALWGAQSAPSAPPSDIVREVPEPLPQLAQLSVEVGTQFEKIYKAMRDSQFIRQIIQACDLILPYRSYIEHDDKLRGVFLETMPGVSFVPLCDFDVKNEYAQAARPEAREFILIYLHKIFTYGYRLYREYASPDINITQMTSVVENAIETLRKQPELNRCSEAFDMIVKSLGKLQENFGEYYIDFLQSRNASTIFEHFVLDVAKDSTSSTQRHNRMIAAQFKKIVGHYQKLAANSGQATQTQAQKLFAQFDHFNSQLGLQNLGRETSRETPAPAPPTK